MIKNKGSKRKSVTKICDCASKGKERHPENQKVNASLKPGKLSERKKVSMGLSKKKVKRERERERENSSKAEKESSTTTF